MVASEAAAKVNGKRWPVHVPAWRLLPPGTLRTGKSREQGVRRKRH